MNTDDLVLRLARDLEPVAPLRPPGARAATWWLGAGLYVALLAAGMAVVNGYSVGTGTAFWAGQTAAIVTSALASAAAFASVVPAFSSRAPGFAILAAVAWLATLAAGSRSGAAWSALSAATHEWLCVAFILAGGAPLFAALAWMLRRGAPLRPATTAAFGALAVVALTNVGACVSLPHANNAVMLAWHGGVMLVATACAAACGRLLFSWRRPPLSTGGP